LFFQINKSRFLPLISLLSSLLSFFGFPTRVVSKGS
jgi:hypothetical protein